MDYFLFMLIFIVGFVLWALKAPVGHPGTPTTLDLAERQRQIDAANHLEVL